jgi:4'-phosphopantetheinyl transferase
LPAPAPIEIWCVDLAHADFVGEHDDLSIDEMARASRFKFERDREHFCRARTALRQLLATHTGLAPAALRFAAGEFDKPVLVAPVPCTFNLSHAGECALIAVSEAGDLGVDIEPLRELPDLPQLAASTLMASELAEIERLPLTLRSPAFLRLWTRKEACLKALGCGLAVAPNTFGVQLHAPSQCVRLVGPHGPAQVAVHALDVGVGYVAAWAEVLVEAAPHGRC